MGNFEEKIERPSRLRPSDLTYDKYLKVEELLALQNPLSQPQHHDEMLFITIHQAYELWFKLILHEMEMAVISMHARQVLRAHHFISRIVSVVRLLVVQIHILETMKPGEFLKFRDYLKPASGFQSVQFREVEFLGGLKDPEILRYFSDQPHQLARLRSRLAQTDLRESYFQLLRDFGLSVPGNAVELEGMAEVKSRELVIRALLPIYSTPDRYMELNLLSEGLVDFDEQMGFWREHHVKVVERVIGNRQGTGGSSGVSYLQTTTSKRFFPSLWDVRTYLAMEA